MVWFSCCVDLCLVFGFVFFLEGGLLQFCLFVGIFILVLVVVFWLVGFCFSFLDFRSFWVYFFPCIFIMSLTFDVLTEFLWVKVSNVSDSAVFLIQALLTEDFGMPQLIGASLKPSK